LGDVVGDVLVVLQIAGDIGVSGRLSDVGLIRESADIHKYVKI